MALIWTYAKWKKAEAEVHASNITVQGAGQREGYVKWNGSGVTSDNGVTSIGVWEVHSRKTSGAGASRSTSGGPPPTGGGQRAVQPPTGPQALAATAANQPQITGGGQGSDVGATHVAFDLPRSDDDWKGLDSYSPDNKLGQGYSPRTINWDSLRRIGARSIRAGLGKLSEDRDTVTASGGGSISSEYRGLSILPIPASGLSNDSLLIVFSDKDVDLGSAPGGSNSQTSFHLMTADVRYGRPRNLTGMPGPTLSLSDQTSQVLRVTAIYDHIPAAQAELREHTVKAITIRFYGPQSGATPYWPLDIDGNDGTESILLNTGTAVDRRTWDGSSTNYDMDLSGSSYGAGKYWVAAWAVSADGISEPSFASITLA